MPISEKQLKILAFPYTKYQALILDGAVRTGKTSVGMVSFVDWAMREFNNTNFIIGGKTVGSARKNIIEPFMALSRTQKMYSVKYRIDGNRMIVRHGRKINTFLVYGGKDESSYTLVQGLTAAGVFLDEVPLLAQSFVNQCLSRTISFDNARYIFTMNADNPAQWFYKDWIGQLQKHNAYRVHFELKDNPALTQEQIDNTANTYDGVFYDRYILGLWVAAEGAIYGTFANNKQKYLTDKPDFDFIQIGVDFGGNRSAHAFVATGLKWDYSTLTVLKSERIEAKGIDPDGLYRHLQDFIATVKAKYGNVQTIYADSAEQTLIAGMRRNISGIPVRNSLKRPIIDRIRATTSLIAQDRFFYTKDCESLVKAMCEAVYDPKQQNDVRLDNGTTDVDALDSFEYSWERYLSKYVKFKESDYDDGDDF